MKRYFRFRLPRRGEIAEREMGATCGRRPSSEQRRFHGIVPWSFSSAALAEDRGGRKASFPPPTCTGIYCYGTILLRSTLCSPALKSAATSSRLFSGESIKIELYYMLLYCILLYNVKKGSVSVAVDVASGGVPPRPANRVAVVAP